MDWKTMPKRLLKAEMARRGIGFSELAERLRAFGVETNRVGATTKVNRGVFSATYFLQCMRAMDVRVLRLDEDWE